MIQLDTHVADIVREFPRAARIFEGIGVDYCCGGKVPLCEVCTEKGLDPATVLTMLNIQVQEGSGNEVRVDDFSTPDLIRHIVDNHHKYLRGEVPRLTPLVHKVARAHSSNDARLNDVAATFDVLVEELMPHQDREEDTVFPKILEKLAEDGQADEELAQLIEEHEEVGRLLAKLRELTDGYKPQEWACPTTLAVLQGLKDFEADIHQHIHKENNILFPRLMKAS